MKSITKKTLSTILLISIFALPNNVNLNTSMLSESMSTISYLKSKLKKEDFSSKEDEILKIYRKDDTLVTNIKKNNLEVNYSEIDRFHYVTINYVLNPEDNKSKILNNYDFKNEIFQQEEYENPIMISKVVNSKIYRAHELNIEKELNEIILRKESFNNFVSFYNINKNKISVTIIPEAHFQEGKHIIMGN